MYTLRDETSDPTKEDLHEIIVLHIYSYQYTENNFIQH